MLSLRGCVVSIYLYEGMTRKEVMIEVRCARQTLVTWIDMYCAGVLESLTQAPVSNKPERLSDEQNPLTYFTT